MQNTVRILFSLGFVVACATTCEADTRAKVLFVGKQPDHPFGTHMYLHTCNMLSKCLSLTEGVETIVSDGWPRDATVLDGVSTIVVYTSPAAELLLDAPHRDEVAALMKKGVGLVTVHWASSVRNDNFDRLGQKWLSYLGGTWVSNVGLHIGKSPLKQLKPDHPICRGWNEYELHDEYYLNPTISGEATPLLQVTAKDKPVVVGWAYERPDGGRSFGTTLGHYYRNFQDERFRRMIVNAILWTAEVEIPKGGARVDLSEKDLALPPNPKN
jgi:type 1 glutamine amidotransferase